MKVETNCQLEGSNLEQKFTWNKRLAIFTQKEITQQIQALLKESQLEKTLLMS